MESSTASGEEMDTIRDRERQTYDPLRAKAKLALGTAKEALKGDDTGAINSARDELMQAFSAAGQEMYQAQAAEAGAEGAGAEGFEGTEGFDPGAAAGEPADAAAGAEAGEEEDVVEADYEIVDEEK